MILHDVVASRKHSPVRRRGLTLMELVVVMTILAALAAIMVPMFPNLLRRSHKVVDATQTAEVAKSVQLHQALYLAYPNGFDLMVDNAGAFPAYVPNDGGATFGGAVAPQALSEDQAKALGRVGITTGFQFATTTTGTDFHPTMNPYAGTVTAPTSLLTGTTGATVAFINKASGNIPNELKNMIAADTTGTIEFVVFGVGPRCSAVGSVMQNAPTSVPQNKNFTPDNLYARVGVIFMVDGPEVQKTQRARFIGSVALEDDELESTEKDLIGYYGVAAAEQP